MTLELIKEFGPWALAAVAALVCWRQLLVVQASKDELHAAHLTQLQTIYQQANERVDTIRTETIAALREIIDNQSP